MSRASVRHGLVEGLTDDVRAEAERLLEATNRHEGLDLPIWFESPQSASDVTAYFLEFEHGSLIGLAWLPDDPEPEACLMIHPQHRRRGVGKKLLAAIRGESRRRGLPGLLIVSDEAAASGVAFLAAVGARFRSAEYRLEFDPTAVERSRPRHDALLLRQAGAEDAATLARLRAASFGVTEAEAREQMDRRDAPGHRYWLAMLGGEPIGMLRTGSWEGTADVTAFAVLPQHRGRGYGRQMLLETVDMLLADGWERIIIEVATDNIGALGLYKSCGFKVATAYGFYDLDT